jgi:acetyl-CoA acetyltransferase
VCASGLKALALGAASLALGHRGLLVAGGMESLSNSPFLLRSTVEKLLTRKIEFVPGVEPPRTAVCL